MADSEFIFGEFNRTLDERFRLSIPTQMIEPLTGPGEELLLVKERPGALSLWNAERWQAKFDVGIDLIAAKFKAGRLEGKIADLQQLGRLLSTRQRNVTLAGKGRLLIPEGFREFLGVDAGGEVLVVGAALCVEIWRPSAWLENLEQEIPEFHKLLDTLSG
ncbi:MAG: division/cell wall cluster transcriptional repressor MraZ [Pirellulaceae bacterium]